MLSLSLLQRGHLIGWNESSSNSWIADVMLHGFIVGIVYFTTNAAKQSGQHQEYIGFIFPHAAYFAGLLMLECNQAEMEFFPSN